MIANRMLVIFRDFISRGFEQKIPTIYHLAQRVFHISQAMDSYYQDLYEGFVKGMLFAGGRIGTRPARAATCRRFFKMAIMLTKKADQIDQLEILSGRQDSNLRPPAPKAENFEFLICLKILLMALNAVFDFK